MNSKFSIIENKKELKNAHNTFINSLKSITTKKQTMQVSTPGGSVTSEINWIESLGIWWLTEIKESGLSYWDVFGTDEPNWTRGNAPEVKLEINAPTKGRNKRTQGQFVKDENGDVYIVHSGKVNVQGEFDKPFYEVYSGPALWIKSEFGDGSVGKYLLISKLSDPSSPYKIAEYVKAVVDYKKSQKGKKVQNKECALLNFLKNPIMFKNYQPVIIKSLLEFGVKPEYSLSKDKIKERIKILNFDRKINLSQSIDIALTALKDVVIDDDDDDEIKIPDGIVTHHEIPACLKICGQKIAHFHIKEPLNEQIGFYFIQAGIKSEYLNEFKASSTVGVDYDCHFDMTDMSKNEIESKTDGMDGTELYNITRINPGDIILVTEGSKKGVHEVGIAISKYFFQENSKTYQHRVKVEFLNFGIPEINSNSPKAIDKILDDETIDKVKRSLIGGKDLPKDMPTNDDLEEKIYEIIEILDWKKNVILYGPPGTGKTYFCEQIKKKWNQDSGKTKIKSLNEIFIASGSWESWTHTMKNPPFRWASGDNPGNRMAYDKINEGDYLMLYQNTDSPTRFPSNCFFGIAKVTKKYISEQPYWPEEVSSGKIKYPLTCECEIIKKIDDEKDAIQFAQNDFKTFAAFNSIGVDNENKEKLLAQIKEIWNVSLTKDDGKIKFVTFHPSYSYEDFIEGYRPIINEDKSIGYELRDGIFKNICKTAKKDSDNKYLLIIDEVNRGNISKIFGELITLIEDNKRNKISLSLAYSQDEFTVPKNLFIIGTMNTADKSLIQMDAALRRRFAFIELMPKSDLRELNRTVGSVHLGKLLDALNKKIRDMDLRDKQIGHSYFMNISENKEEGIKELQRVFKYEIIPLLQDYLYEDYNLIAEVLGKMISKEEMSVNDELINNSEKFQDELLKIIKDKSEPDEETEPNEE